MHAKMKNLLFQIVVSMAAVLLADAQTPMKPPVLDVKYLLEISKPEPGCPICSGTRAPSVEESLSPAYAIKLPDCDRIEVALLVTEFKNGSAAVRFPNRLDQATSGILDHKDLRGPDATRLCSLWRGLTFDNRYPGIPPVFARTPTYGLRFHRSDKVVFETCVNFSTGNFYYPRTVFPVIPGGYSWHGFRTGDEAGKALASFLKATLPGKAAGE